MKIRRDMKIKAVLELDEKLLNALLWLAPEFDRLRNARLRRAMSGRITVAQAARLARIPLAEMLYVLNLAAGEDETKLAAELKTSNAEDFELHETNPPAKPLEIINTKDADNNVLFVDLMPYAEALRDPMPAIAKGLLSLKNPTDVLLLKHPFDPIPLRDMFARRGFASWAEERKPAEWFIYFYRPAVSAKAAAYPSISNRIYAKTTAAHA